MRLPDAIPERQSLEPARAPDAKGLRSLAVVLAVSAALVVLALHFFSRWSA